MSYYTQYLGYSNELAYGIWVAIASRMPCVDPLHILVFSSLSVCLQVLAQLCILKTGGIGEMKVHSRLPLLSVDIRLT